MVPEEEWIRVENTHEPIIDKETFYKAQELNKRDTRILQKTKELSVWAGLLKCKDCGRAMNKKSSTNKSGSIYQYYICSTYRKKSNNLCTKHSIKVEKLEKAVLQAINLHIKLLIDIEEIEKQISTSSLKNEKDKNIESMIVSKQNEISKIQNLKMGLYQDWKNEDITKEEYVEYKKKYEDDIERLKQNIERLENERQKNENKQVSSNEWIENFKNQKQIHKLSRDIMIELIDYIYIHENGDITIKFKFEDEFKRDLEHMKTINL